MTKPVVFIGTPCYGGLVTELYLHSLIALMSHPGARGVQLTLRTGHDSLITRSRNTIVSAFLDMPEATHLMFIDADLGFEPEAFFRLLNFDAELVAGIYPVKFFDWKKIQQAALGGATPEKLQLAGLSHVGVACKEPERETRDGFVTGTHAGCGFMLIKRTVFERIAAAHPELQYKRAQTHPVAEKQSEHLYSFFDCAIDPETGIYLSEDFAFCQRWLKLGGKLWLDVRCKLVHSGIQTFGAFSSPGTFTPPG